MAFVPRFNWKRSVGLAKPIRAKSAVAFEPQGGDLTKPRPTAWVNGTPTDTPALKGRNNPFQSHTYRSSWAIPWACKTFRNSSRKLTTRWWISCCAMYSTTSSVSAALTENAP